MENTLQTIALLSNETYCPASRLETVHDNIVEIAEKLESLGYSIGTLSSFSAITNSTIITALRARFNTYEQRIWQITRNLDYITDNSLSNVYTWKITPIDIKEQLNRIFAWCNEQKEVIDGAYTSTQPLCDVNGELTRDVNNVIIYVEVN